ncbi:MAG: sodium/glutamate symporter [Bacilli bacterium]|jgi:ESS family glutamate:Na+ symporter
MEFWEFNINFKQLWIIIGIIAVLFLISNVLRRKVGIIRKSLLPTAIIAGLLMLILKSLGLFELFNINRKEINDFFEAMTYHGLGFGVIAMTLKSTPKDKAKGKQVDVFNSGLITVNTYLIQGIIGAGITLLLSATFLKGLFPASGLLLPLGYGQGSGQAVTFGHIFETKHGFVGGASFGLTVATIGFLVACFVGVGHIIVMRRRGKIKAVEKNEFVSTEVVASPNEVPVTEAVDRMTIQIVLILLVYFLTYLFMFGVEQLPLGTFGNEKVKPMVWGFNFLIGSLLAALLKVVFRGLKKANLMTRDYPNNYLLNRISGFSFDMMIITGTAAIEIAVLKELIIPLVLICLIGGIVTYFYVRKLSYLLFPGYQEEALLSLFGMLTGTTSTGMILLREVDSKFETPAASNLIYQSFYAIALGFPLFLLLGVAPEGPIHTLVSIIILIVMFIVFNILLFRKQIFKKKDKA